MTNQQPLLLVEDSPEDYEATLRALRRTGLGNQIFHCSDGDGALDYLFRRRQYADTALAPRPGLILLDLNLPGTDGREVLAEIKRHEGLKSIPVIILTTSTAEDDVATCYLNGASSYIQKPVDSPRFFEAIRRLKDYWLEIVILPKAE